MNEYYRNNNDKLHVFVNRLYEFLSDISPQQILVSCVILVSPILNSHRQDCTRCMCICSSSSVKKVDDVINFDTFPNDIDY